MNFNLHAISYIKYSKALDVSRHQSNFTFTLEELRYIKRFCGPR